MSERYDSSLTQPNALPISDEASSQRDDASCDEPAPPGVPPPPQTPTPTPKRPRSLLLEKSEDASVCAGEAQPKRLMSHSSGNLKKVGNYGTAALASRWNARLKRMKATRGGSRKGGAEGAVATGAREGDSSARPEDGGRGTPLLSPPLK